MLTAFHDLQVGALAILELNEESARLRRRLEQESYDVQRAMRASPGENEETTLMRLGKRF